METRHACFTASPDSGLLHAHLSPLYKIHTRQTSDCSRTTNLNLFMAGVQLSRPQKQRYQYSSLRMITLFLGGMYYH